MRKESIRWLLGELPGLVEGGIIPDSAAQALRAYYESRGGLGVGLGRVVFAVAGALLVGLGVVLLAAHNWVDLSRPVQVALGLAPLAAGQCVLLWAAVRRPDSQVWREGCAGFVALALGAAMVVVSQAYSVHGDLGTFLFTWLALLLPLAYAGGFCTPAAIVLVLLPFVVVDGPSTWQNSAKILGLLLAVVPLFLTFARRDRYGVRTSALGWAMAWAVSAGGFSCFMDGAGESWLLILPLGLGMTHCLGVAFFGAATVARHRPFESFGLWGLVVVALLGSTESVWTEFGGGGFVAATMPTQEWLAAAVSAIAIVGAAVQALRQGRTRVLMPAVVSLAAGVSWAQGVLFGLPFAAAMTMNAAVLALSVERILRGLRGRSAGLVNFGLILLVLLVLIRFFDSEYGYLERGIVFIVVGAVFVGANILLHKAWRGAQ